MTESQFYAEYIYNAFALSLHKSFIVFLRKFDYIHCKLNTKKIEVKNGLWWKLLQLRRQM